MNLKNFIANPESQSISKSELAGKYIDDILDKLNKGQFDKLFEYQEIFVLDILEDENSTRFIDILTHINHIIK